MRFCCFAVLVDGMVCYGMVWCGVVAAAVAVVSMVVMGREGLWWRDGLLIDRICQTDTVGEVR